MYHEHPLRILRYSAKNIWLLIFPLLRGLNAFTFDVGRLYHWLKGAWFDIAVLGAILIFGLIRWYFSRITVTDETIIHTDGVFVKVRTAIPYRCMSSATIEHSFYLRPFGGMMVSFDTPAGIFSATDMKLMVNKKVCRELMKNIPEVNRKDSVSYVHKPNLISILLFSVFFSSSFSGAVYVAAFFFKGGDIAKDIISVSLDRITEETSKLPLLVIRKIPAAAIGIGSFFLATWFLSFIINMLRYYGFIIKSDSKRIDVVCGTVTRRSFKIMTNKINYTDLRQNLVMKIFNAVTINVSCAGYGSESSRIPVLFPIRRQKRLNTGLEQMATCTGKKTEFRCGIRSIWQYIWQPVIISLCLYPASEIVSELFPKFADLSYFAMIMSEIPSIWMIFVKAAAAATSSIAIYDDGSIMLKCSKGFGFHTVIADKERLAKIKITRTPGQILFRKCTVSFYFNGERTQRYFVKGIWMKDAEKMARILGYYSITRTRK